MSGGSSPIAQDTLKNAIKMLSELALAHPEKERKELIEEITLKFDLSPLECEFLNNHFSLSDKVNLE